MTALRGTVRPVEPARPGRCHRTPDGRLQCDVCPHGCVLEDGERGACYVRQRVGDAVVLAGYGRACGLVVEPVEAVPLLHVLPGSAVLSVGAAGCVLDCRSCEAGDVGCGAALDADATPADPDALARLALDLGCRAVALNGTDPVAWVEYARDVADAARGRGLRVVAVTSGYVLPEPRAELVAGLDAVTVSLKAFTDGFYRRVTGGALAPVLETLEHLVHASQVWVETTTEVVPGLNDSTAELDRMTRWVVDRLGPDVPMRFSGFTPAHRLLDRPRTPPDSVRRAAAIARRNGVRYVYTDNVHDGSGGTTRCRACGTVVVERRPVGVTAFRLTDSGRCGGCGTRVPGIFDGPAGAWDGRSLPVRLAS